MTLVLIVAVLAVATAVLSHRADRLADLQARAVRLLVAAAGLQLVVALVAPGSRGLRLFSVTVSVLLVALFLARNRRLPGVPLIGLGLALNAAVIAVNAAMPVSLAAAARAGIPAADLRLEGDAMRKPAGEGTRLRPLGDTIPVALPGVPQVVSPGDLLVAAGVGLMLVTGSRRRRPAARANRTAEASASTKD